MDRQHQKFKVHAAFQRKEVPVHRPRPRSPGKSLKTVFFVFAGVVALAAFYTVYWFFMAANIRSNAVNWAAEMVADGYTVRYSQLKAGGFPWGFHDTMENAALGGKGWLWQSAGLTLSARPWSPGRITVVPTGALSLAFNEGDKTTLYSGRAGVLSAEFTFADGWPVQAEITARDLSIAQNDTNRTVAIEALTLGFTHQPDAKADDGTATMDVSLQAQGILVSPPSLAALTGGRNGLELEARLLGDLARGPLADSLKAWRDGGGTVQITRLKADLGALGIQADGTLALDEAMQPIGAFVARIKGFFPALQALKRAGVISAKDAVTAMVVLSAMARKKTAGGPFILTMPVTIQDLNVHVGPVSLFEIPPLNWGYFSQMDVPDPGRP